MQILHILDSLNPKNGGPVQAVRQYATLMPQFGNSVEVACCDDPEADYVRDFPAKVSALGPCSDTAVGKRMGDYSYSPRLRPWLVKNIERFDAVVISGIWQYPCLAGSSVCRNVGKRYWVFTHGMLDPWFNKTYPLKRIKKLLFWPSLYSALRSAESVLFTTDEERTLARQSFWPYHVRERVVAYGAARPPIEHGNHQASAFLSRFPELDGKRFLLFLGRIDSKKGCDLLLKAFDHIAREDKSLYLVMAGPVSREYRAELKKIPLSTTAKERIVWTGMLKGDEKIGAFRTAEAFILPSHQENFGIAVAEALACGKPVLISNRVNTWRVIDSHGAGIAATDDLEGTIGLLRKWGTLSKEARDEMGRRAIECYERNFTVESAAMDLNNVLRIGTGLDPNRLSENIPVELAFAARLMDISLQEAWLKFLAAHPDEDFSKSGRSERPKPQECRTPGTIVR